MKVAQLEKILKDAKANLRGKEFGEAIIERIESTHEFLNDSSLLKEYLQDYIETHTVEVRYLKKYSPLIYHENTYKHLEAEMKTASYILEKLK